MSQIVWLPDALMDVERLRVSLQEKNPNAAARAGQTLRDGANALAGFPQNGRPMNDGSERRVLFLPFGAGAYVLRYPIDGDNIVIIRV
ncbi:type II toxin-antitoxin system RelE/ParE family toxin [Methylomonas koyamae]|uniref:type II toxin-antitoxin system RelE/ParE family toxin n=1 Tax=Methylomonas koyamae TaxID=702114 RepID=UPI0009EEF1B4|nr:type II toxin-antitoxin system RelE/ParE family toxin [Methylomonas koyamae]